MNLHRRLPFLFTIIPILLARLLTGSPVADGFPYGLVDGVTVPPGGYAWTAVDGDDYLEGFHVVPVLASGPWPLLRADLPDEAIRAMDSCGEWLGQGLMTRFSDLLYQDLLADLPAVPVPADIDGDGVPDLIVKAPDGSVQQCVLLPGLELTGLPADVYPQTMLQDVNGDGLPDTAMVRGDGTIVIASGGRPLASSTGWDLPTVSGTALMDMEGDGLSDLVIGTENGRILVCRNRGTVRMPCFLPSYTQNQVAFPMEPGAFSAPSFMQEGDSLLRLAVGTAQDGLRIYTAVPSRRGSTPVWTDSCTTIGQGHLMNVTPVTVSNGDAEMLLCGTRNGDFYAYAPGRDLTTLPPVPGTYPILTSAMMDDDTIPDLVAGTMEGTVFFLRGDGDWFAGDWIPVTGLPVMPSCAPAAWGEGLVFGTEEGALRYFELGVSGEWTETVEGSPFLGIDVGEYCVPCFADIDFDGTDEMVTGSASGRLTLFELEESFSDEGPLFIERLSWEYRPSGAVQELDSYYSRYFRPYTVLRVPTGTGMVSAYASEILSAPMDQRDEVAFCIAATPTETLIDMFRNGDQDLFSLNSRLLYEAADRLSYAEIADSSGIGWCRLRTAEGWFDIDPMDYYRYVVHPRILFEIPARIDAGYWSEPRDSSSLSVEEWLNQVPEDLYGHTEDHVFWREFIPSDSSSGRALMESMMQAMTYEEAVVRICNFQSHSQPGGLMSFGYATNDLQPMVIYSKAYGSCGEQSILQTALCRAFLVPAYVVGCRGEDHQWAHYLEPSSGRWDHWDVNYGILGIGCIWVSGEGIDHTGKTISTISAFGPDNTVWPVTESAIASPGSGYMPGDSGYTPTAEVSVRVTDPAGRPVEGAMVLARSHWENANSVSIFDYTDLNGECGFRLGWEPLGGYTFDVVSPFGTTGSGSIAFREGSRYTLEYTVPCTMPSPQQVQVPDAGFPAGTAINEVFLPVSYFSGSLYSIDEDDDRETATRGWSPWSLEPGTGRVLFMDSANFRLYRGGMNCRALPEPFEPSPGDTCYAVLDNRNALYTWVQYLPGTAVSLPAPLDTGGIEWLEADLPVRIPVVSCWPVGDTVCYDPASGSVFALEGLGIGQDDPTDPLSAGQVLGPFRIPAGQRGLSIETESRTPGLDLDLYLFRDSDFDLEVDGMEELHLSSTTPTSSERIEISQADTSSVYWIYMLGWQVPDDSAEVDLRLSFVPEMVPAVSLYPSGHVTGLPGLFSFLPAQELRAGEQLFIAADGDTLEPVLQEGRWTVQADKMADVFLNRELNLLDGAGNPLGEFRWVLSVDSVPPVLGPLAVSIDTSRMVASFEILCDDPGSGIRRVFMSGDSLTDTPMRHADSLWKADIDLLPMSFGTVHLTVSAEDSAGNDSVRDLQLEVPERPAVVFSEAYPTGNTYDHTPYLQVLADVRSDAGQWHAAGSLTDSTGTQVLGIEPLIIDGGLLQFRTTDPLPDGAYVAGAVITDAAGVEIGEFQWTFDVRTMDWMR